MLTKKLQIFTRIYK